MSLLFFHWLSCIFPMALLSLFFLMKDSVTWVHIQIGNDCDERSSYLTNRDYYYDLFQFKSWPYLVSMYSHTCIHIYISFFNVFVLNARYMIKTMYTWKDTVTCLHIQSGNDFDEYYMGHHAKQIHFYIILMYLEYDLCCDDILCYFMLVFTFRF